MIAGARPDDLLHLAQIDSALPAYRNRLINRGIGHKEAVGRIDLRDAGGDIFGARRSSRIRQPAIGIAGEDARIATGAGSNGTVREIAATGVDRISIGALTKDVKAIDFSMRMQEL